MKRFLINTIISIWLVVAIFTTVTLLSFNNYRVAEFGNYSLFNIDNDSLEPTFKEGDLVITKRTSPKNVNPGEDIFYYDENSTEAIINVGTVRNKETVTDTEVSYFMQNGKRLSSSFVFGTVNGSKVLPVAGLVLSVLQSRWGFMFFVIFPTILLLVYEIYSIYLEVKREKNSSKENEEEIIEKKESSKVETKESLENKAASEQQVTIAKEPDDPEDGLI